MDGSKSNNIFGGRTRVRGANPMADDIKRRINRLVPKAFGRDRIAARRKLSRLNKARKGGVKREKIEAKLLQIEQDLKTSASKRRHRVQSRPRLAYNEALPIAGKKDDIIDAIRSHPVVVISGETGSGKTTQIPKFCLAAGRGIDGMIGCTQPRRIAATTVSRRIAEELGEPLGRSVGYKIRFQDKTDLNAYIKIMTDGMLLAETQSDPKLRQYDTIIVDEAHERSLNIDFILGIMKDLLKQRSDLKLIITSATIDTEKFSRAFDNAPIIEVSGRLYPVEVVYHTQDGAGDDEDPTYVESAVQAADRLLAETVSGDILMFMPGEQDIRETCEMIEGRHHPVKVYPLFARLPGRDQTRIFSRAKARKIIVATNIAETSITIPGIKYVIDTGLARISQYMPRSRTTSLSIRQVSRSSADQRKGRCGRIENGICIRLYSEEEYVAQPAFTPPEVLRSNLAEVILRMIALRLGDPKMFPFVDSPAPRSVSDGFDLLEELGAIKSLPEEKRHTASGRYVLTARGKLMAKLPIDPRLSRMLLEAKDAGCLQEMVAIAASLSVQDPWERPADHTEEADRQHALFAHPASDFMTRLALWEQIQALRRQGKSTGQIKRYCKTRFLSYRRVREWSDVHTQISAILREQGVRQRKRTTRSKEQPTKAAPIRGRQAKASKSGFDPRYSAIHKSILCGFISNIALKKSGHIYRAAKDREVMVFPGSSLFGRSGKWIVASEMVETSRLFARTVANIDPNWLEQSGKDLCRYTYHSPHWERHRGEVMASEQVSLYGLIIVAGRPVSFGPIDGKAATDIFIRHALLEGDVKKPFEFMQHNQTIVDSIRSTEDKVRRRDLLIGDEELVWFYQDRLGICYSIQSLRKHLRDKGTDRHLRMTREALLRYTPDKEELSQYPDRIKLGTNRLELAYRYDPGEDDDGMTIRVPSAVASEVPREAIDWLVPGLFREKITLLIKGLPKAYRKRLVPVGRTVDVIIDEMPKSGGNLLTALSSFLYERFDVSIPAPAWPVSVLPEHLKARIAITGPKGEELAAARDPSILDGGNAQGREPKEAKAARKRWEKTGISEWNSADIPEDIRISRQGRDARDSLSWMLYPGLEPSENSESVNLRLFDSRSQAEKAHRQGVAVLYANHFKKDLRFLKKRLSLPKDLIGSPEILGGTKALEKRIYGWVLKTLFAKNIRGKSEFFEYAANISPILMTRGQDCFDTVLPVIEAYAETHRLLLSLVKGHRFSTTVQDLLQELMNQLGRLIPANFMDLYGSERFIHLQRYARAIGIRAERAIIDSEKDSEKAKAVSLYTGRLDQLISDLPSAVSPEKQNALEALFWMIEEYKVSQFAQELKTPSPISRKRLDRKIGEVERMV